MIAVTEGLNFFLFTPTIDHDQDGEVHGVHVGIRQQALCATGGAQDEQRCRRASTRLMRDRWTQGNAAGAVQQGLAHRTGEVLLDVGLVRDVG